ncbi:MAG: amidohydrolase [Burkholderiales bacterium]|nr:amidohydrolase [Burkholderiales bacterium]
MFFTCTPGCTDPAHRHGPARAAAARPAARLTRPLARTRKGAAKVVDLHCHYLNPAVNQKTAHLNPGQYDPTTVFADAITRETNVKQMATRAPKLTGVVERLKDMDKMGIDIQAVCAAPYHFFYWTEPAFGAELARDVNHGIAKIAADMPDRFVGMGSVPLQNAELAIRELEYCAKTLGFRGIEICTSVNGRNLTDPELGLDRFFARAEELGVLIFMHPLGWTQADRLTHHYFNNVIGNPLDSTVAVGHLIFDGVLARYPKLRFLVAHGGAYVAHYWARMDHAWRARPDCRTVIKRKPSSYLEKFYFDTITHDPLMLKRLVERFGADHVVLGTDYPYDMGDYDPRGTIAKAGLTRAERAQVEGGNAARLLKIRF